MNVEEYRLRKFVGHLCKISKISNDSRKSKRFFTKTNEGRSWTNQEFCFVNKEFLVLGFEMWAGHPLLKILWNGEIGYFDYIDKISLKVVE